MSATWRAQWRQKPHGTVHSTLNRHRHNTVKHLPTTYNTLSSSHQHTSSRENPQKVPTSSSPSHVSSSSFVPVRDCTTGLLLGGVATLACGARRKIEKLTRGTIPIARATGAATEATTRGWSSSGTVGLGLIARFAGGTLGQGQGRHGAASHSTRASSRSIHERKGGEQCTSSRTDA